ncbi:DUF6884 domain-containing protein [Raineyella fluvialis]|uniref:DUF6884 domain-containing protein n=1 Tax=Raineyella fluvialis TaxID=2662261 RepID=A0A5Q2F704_9ACTN|nr:DUF6884 domain-containing protein [Raineyella fluvialis]QGF22599.1 hypothetical protein Rai3103_01675 [Raineyella fluvialis]
MSTTGYEHCSTPGASDPDSTLFCEEPFALVSCGKAKRSAPSAAADLYTSDSFRKRRAIAEDAGRAWFILSAQHGLVPPDEVLAPYDLALAETGPDYRSAWGAWVVAKLMHKVGPLNSKSVLVLAPAAYADAIRPHLQQAGARLKEPLVGLRQGEQGAWLAAEVRRHRLAGGGPATTAAPVTVASVDDHVREARDAAVAAALVAYRESNEKLHESRLGYADTAEADELLQTDPFAFLLGVVLDEGIRAERAWGGPLELKKRLGHLDPWRVRDQRDDVRAAVAGPPALHRFVEIMAEAIVDAADRVCSTYGGDASRLWAPGSTAAQVDARLRKFRKIGPKKAAMAVELLVTHFGIELAELQGTNVAYDVHVRRVFLRTGLVDRDDIREVTRAARSLYPARPGYLDLPAWLIGRGWCHATGPDCAQCPWAMSARC